MLNKTGISFVVLPAALSLACLIFPRNAHSQINNHGAGWAIAQGATLSVQGDLRSTVSIEGSGTVLMAGEATQSLDMQGQSLQNLTIQNNQGVRLTGNLQVEQAVTFQEGHLLIEDQDLILSDSANINGYDDNHFIITHGAGSVSRMQLGPSSPNGFFFPIGYSATEYNPVQVINLGQPDNIAVRSTEDPYQSAPPNNSHLVRCGWMINETIPGGSDISIRAGWRNSDEPTGFLNTKNGLARYRTNRGWDLPASGIGLPETGSYFSQSRSHLDSLGYFAIADSAMANRATLHLKVFLQGAYSGNTSTTGLMRDDLRNNQAIPAFQPYNGGLFAHVGLQGGTEMVNPIVFAAGSNTANDIVDWVFVSLINPSSPTQSLQTRAALLQRDGDIVDLDGLSDLSMPFNEEGHYLIGVGHRNHLRIRTPDNQSLYLTTGQPAIAWDFSSGNQQAYQNPIIQSNSAMIAVTNGNEERYCMIGGNTDGLIQVNSNARSVIYSGSGNDRTNILVYALNGNPSNSAQISAYNYEDIGSFDLNMDGQILYAGAGNDPQVILQALGGITSIIVREHY